MSDATIRREIEIDAPVERVWPLVATEEGLRQWWGGQIALEPKEGGRCEEWSRGPDGERRQHGVVTVYDPPRRLALTFQPEDDGEWPLLSTITIQVEESAGRSKVKVIHEAHSLVPVEAVIPGRAPATHAVAGPQMSLGRTAGVAAPRVGIAAPDMTDARLQRQWANRLAALQAAVEGN
jgi:uncharacterized protein YndB with AHSA1/START domain